MVLRTPARCLRLAPGLPLCVSCLSLRPPRALLRLAPGVHLCVSCLSLRRPCLVPCGRGGGLIRMTDVSPFFTCQAIGSSVRCKHVMARSGAGPLVLIYSCEFSRCVRCIDSRFSAASTYSHVRVYGN